MRGKKNVFSILAASVVMLLMIFDTKTATEGARAGIDLCLKVIIPALFPFFVITTYLNTALLGLQIPGLQGLGRLLKVPSGGSSLLLLGLIGGYPVGAQLITETYKTGKLDRRSGQILLGYCSNAGPAFLFGVVSTIFTSKWIPLFLWGIHLLSAILTGLLLPKPKQKELQWAHHNPRSVVEDLQKSIYICASVCGWVVIFKIIMAYSEHWALRCCSDLNTVLIGGILELSNGCLSLVQLESESLRFILCAAFLAFGGICILLQTMSVTESLGLGLYIPGKIIQTCFSLLLAIPTTYFLFPTCQISASIAIYIPLSASVVIAALQTWIKKRYGNS